MSVPHLVWSDGWLLSAVLFAGDPPVTLPQLIETADYLNRAVPEFDEVSYGIPRLVATGLLEVTADAGAMAFAPTPRARGLVSDGRRGMIDLMFDIADELRGPQAAPDFGTGQLGELADALSDAWAPEPDDRSLGRLAGLDEAQWARSVDAYCRR